MVRTCHTPAHVTHFADNNCATRSISLSSCACATCSSGYLCVGNPVCNVAPSLPTLSPASCPPSIIYAGTVGRAAVNVTVPQTITGSPGCGATVSAVYNVSSFMNIPVASLPLYVGATVVDSATGLASATSCAFAIVPDSTPPNITCPPTQNVTPNTGVSTAVLVIVSVPATDDNGVPSVLCGTYTKITTTGNNFGLGKVNVTCTATDVAGNTRACWFYVNNTETTAPNVRSDVALAAPPLTHCRSHARPTCTSRRPTTCRRRRW